MRFSPVLFSLCLTFTGFAVLPKEAIAQSNNQINQTQQDDSSYKTQLDKLLKDGYTKLAAKDISGAIAIYEQAHQLAQLQKNIFDQSRILGILGRVYDFDGKYAASERSYQEGLKLLDTKRQPSDNPKQISIRDRLQIDLLTGLGMTYRKIGQFSEAVSPLKLAISLSKNISFAEAERLQIEPRFELANVYKNQKRYQEAISLYKECLDLVRKMGDQEKENLTLTALGNTYFLMGDLKQGREFYHQKNKSLDFGQSIKSIDKHDLESVRLSLINLNRYLKKTVPLLKQSSHDLLKMYSRLPTNQNFGAIKQLGKIEEIAANLFGNLSSAVSINDISSAFSLLQKLDNVVTLLTTYDLEDPYLMGGDLNRTWNFLSLKDKSLDFGEPIKLSDADNLESIDATLTNLVGFLEKTVPNLRQTSYELLRMYALVSTDSRFDVIGNLGKTVGLSADHITNLSSVLKQGDLISALSIMQSLDNVMTDLTAYQKDMDVLMLDVQARPESYKVLTPEVLREMEQIGHNLEKINQSLGGKSKSDTKSVIQKVLIGLDALKKN